MSLENIPRRFEFHRDSFAFANELVWEYRLDAATGKMASRRCEPPPAYTHRCFVLTRAARQFLYHVQFDPTRAAVPENVCRDLIRAVVGRNPRQPCAPVNRIVIPGHASLHEFSAAREHLLKTECGGAWQSYVLRSHWRMIFPISRSHQGNTAARLAAKLQKGFSPIIHLVTFPVLAINHGMVLFAATETTQGWEFSAYDPNDPVKPARLLFDRATRTFSLPANHYWAGGELNVIEIFRSWLM